jgi:hypothetical protein
MTTTTVNTEALRRRYCGYAAKWHADVVNEGLSLEPTDANLAAVLGHCARAPRSEEYASIRAAIAA